MSTSVTAAPRVLTTTAVRSLVATFSGSAGMRRRFRIRPPGSETASSSFIVSAVTNATGLPPDAIRACEDGASSAVAERISKTRFTHFVRTGAWQPSRRG